MGIGEDRNIQSAFPSAYEGNGNGNGNGSFHFQAAFQNHHGFGMSTQHATSSHCQSEGTGFKRVSSTANRLDLYQYGSYAPLRQPSMAGTGKQDHVRAPYNAFSVRVSSTTCTFEARHEPQTPAVRQCPVPKYDEIHIPKRRGTFRQSDHDQRRRGQTQFTGSQEIACQCSQTASPLEDGFVDDPMDIDAPAPLRLGMLESKYARA